MSLHTWSDYTLALFDRDRVFLAVLDEVSELRWEKRLFGGGTFSFRLPLEAAGADLIAPDALYFVRLWRDGVALLDGYFERPAWALEADGERWLTVEGPALGNLAHWRAGLPLAGGTPLTTTAPIDDALKWVVRRTLGDLAPTVAGGGARVLPGLVVAADASACPTTDTVTFQARPGYTLHDFLCKWGGRYGVDWDLAFNDDGEIVFDTYTPRRGADRSVGNAAGVQPVIVNDAIDTMATWRLYWSAREHHNAWIGRTLAAEVRDDTAVGRWLRRETISPSGDPDANAAALSEAGVVEGIAQGFVETAGCQFMGPEGASFAVGDTVTVGHRGQAYGPVDLTVAAVRGHVLGDGREELLVVFGDPEPSAADRARRGPGSEDDPFSLPYAVPAVTYGAAAVEGSADELMRADAVLPLSFVADSGSATPDPDAANALTLAGGHGCTTSVAAAPDDHTITLDTDWARDTVGGGLALYPYVAGDDLRVRAAGGGTVVHLSAAGASAFAEGATFAKDVAIAAGVGIVHGDGVTAGRVLRADGTRYVPAALQAGDLPDLSATYAVVGHDHDSAYSPLGHSHDHGALSGLADDDHAQYVLADGSRPLSDDWDVGAHQLRASTFYADGDYFYLGDTATHIRRASSQVRLVTDRTYITLWPGSTQTVNLSTTALYPAASGTTNLGLSSLRWDTLYAVDADLSGALSFSATEYLDDDGAGGTRVYGAGSVGLYANGTARLVVGVHDVAVNADLLPNADNTSDLGRSSRRWAELHAVTATFSGLVTAAQLDVGGQCRCDSLRIDASAGAYGDETLTHCLAISVNGTTYRLPMYVP